jgi:hypothetical protein
VNRVRLPFAYKNGSLTLLTDPINASGLVV